MRCRAEGSGPPRRWQDPVSTCAPDCRTLVVGSCRTLVVGSDSDPSATPALSQALRPLNDAPPHRLSDMKLHGPWRTCALVLGQSGSCLCRVAPSVAEAWMREESTQRKGFGDSRKSPQLDSPDRYRREKPLPSRCPGGISNHLTTSWTGWRGSLSE